SVRNTNFVNFRTGGNASFGLFDSTCYGVLDNLYIDGICDSTANGGSLIGVFATDSGNGARLTNSTIYVRTGEAAESAYGAMRSTSTFINTSGTTVYTNYAVPATFAAAGGTAEALPSDYEAEYYNASDGDFVKTSIEGTLTSVTFYGGDAPAVDLTANATLSSGTLTIPKSVLKTHLAIGATIKAVTDEDVYRYFVNVRYDETIEENYFALKQTNNSGTIVNNNYSVTLYETNVSSVTIGETSLTNGSDYTVTENTLTVLNGAFSGLDNGGAQTVTVTTKHGSIVVEIGKVATFAVTKASDINTGSSSVVAPVMVAGGVSSSMSNPASEQAQWRGYFILVNDIDFGGENIVHKCMTQNAYGGNGWGLNGTFDGLGHTFSNFQVRGTNVSFFGRIDFYGSVKNTRFVDFRTSGQASFGLFDSTCYGNLDNLYIDGTCDSTANNGSLLGVFETYSGNGARLTNSTIYVRTGEATESAYGAIRSTSTFISTSGTTLYTNYAVPATFTAKGGTVLPLNGGNYYALKVAADDTESGDVVTNNFVKTSLEGTLTSVTLYGRNAAEADLTSSATLTSGTFTIPASALSSYTGRGISIKVVTSANTYWYYQDIATYAITGASDFKTSTGFAIPKFAKACGMTTRGTNWSGYIILANSVDFKGASIYNDLPSANWGDTGKFGGTIDGRGYALSDFSLAGNNGSWRSLFGASNSSATYKNLKITGYTRGSGLIGGLFEYCSALIDNVYIDCTISGNETQGSMFGWVQTSCRVTNTTIIARTGNAARIMMISASGTYTNSTIYTDADKSAKVDGSTYTWGGAFKSLSELPA
ncbi:MAG: hypothetical protein IJS67_05480, partial [Clostridia bacterium]|nr:hypothetical protein [Clostridia bacterium]